MKCQNCYKDAGPKGHNHIKSRKYTCKRPSSSGSGYEASLIIDSSASSYNDWGSSPENSIISSNYPCGNE